MKLTRWRLVLLLSILAALALPAAVILAQAGSYEVRWWTADGGGATFSEGGGYRLGGTIGQADAGVSSGGPYTVKGGFSGGARQPTPTPTATETPTATATVTATPTEGPSPTPTATATEGPSPTPTNTATEGPSPTPTSTATEGPSPTPTTPPEAGGSLYLPVVDR